MFNWFKNPFKKRMPKNSIFCYEELVEYCAENSLDYRIYSTLTEETIVTTMGGVTETYKRLGFGSMFYRDSDGEVKVVENYR